MSGAVPFDAAPGGTIVMRIGYGLDAVVTLPLGRAIEDAQLTSATL